jgi:anaerobic selenocysteine-containing dehydrogenase
LAGLAQALGQDFGWHTVADVWADIKKEVPTHAEVDLDALEQRTPPSTLQYESAFAKMSAPAVVAGPGAGYPKGYRSGAPFHTGQSWPLSWELRAFEAKQRPGLIPAPASSDGESMKWTEVIATRPVEAGKYALYSGRLLYDDGAMVSKSALLRGLAKKPFVEMNDEDVKELGLNDGDEVVLTADGFEATCRLAIADIAKGTVFVPYDQPGLRANELIRDVDPTVEVRGK